MSESKNFSIENNIIRGLEKHIPLGNQSLGEIILDALNATPDHACEVDAETGKITTMQDLKNNSIILALWLLKQGVKPGEAVALCETNHPYVSSIIFATLFTGAIYSPWDHELDTVKARHFMKMVQPKVIFCCNNKLDIINEASKLENLEPIVIAIDESSEILHVKTIINSQSNDKVEDFKPAGMENKDNMCFIAFTSGTTSMSKGVARTYERSLRRILEHVCDIKGNKIILTHCFPSWSIHFWTLIHYTLSKWTCIIEKKFDDVQTSKNIEKYKVNVLELHTYNLMRICEENADCKYNFESVEEVTTVGTSVSKDVVDATARIMPNAFVLRLMGLTEVGPISSFTRDCKNPLSCGHVRPNVQVKIIDTHTGKSLSFNEEGELCVKTLYIMNEYYKDPEATKAMFDNEGWFHTGDSAYYDENGELVIHGRLKEIIKYRYYDIYPWDIEKVLSGHPEVIEVAVIPVSHPLDYERPLAFVKIVPGSKVTEKELVDLTENLDYQKLLEDEVHFIDEMPRSTNGKILKKVLKEKAKELKSKNSLCDS